MSNYHLVDKDIIRSVGDGKYHDMAIRFHGTAIWNGNPIRNMVHSTGGDLNTLQELLSIDGEVDYLYIDKIKVYNREDNIVTKTKATVDYDRAMGVL